LGRGRGGSRENGDVFFVSMPPPLPEKSSGFFDPPTGGGWEEGMTILVLFSAEDSGGGADYSDVRYAPEERGRGGEFHIAAELLAR
jgi:hypothetical protein